MAGFGSVLVEKRDEKDSVIELKIIHKDQGICIMQ